MKLKSKVAVAVFVNLLIGQSTSASQRITVVGVTITGGALELLGTISTSSADDTNPSIGYIGWGLIVVGSLVNGGQIANAAEAAPMPAAEVWSAIVRESRVYAHNPDLIQSDLPIANAASSMGIKPKELAQLVLELDVRAMNSKTAKIELSTDDLRGKYFPMGINQPSQWRAFDNLVLLSSMN